MAKPFKIHSQYTPRGDQPEAIAKLTQGLEQGKRAQVLLGITGSGKTFTMANVIENVQKPTLIMAHNKTLAAQLYEEFKEFFPHNAVEYFVSYYDYYQPEAYVPRTDTFIEKSMSINETIDKMRLSATRSLLERSDVIIIASVSCIYGLGSPEFYRQMNLQLDVGQVIRRQDLLLHLVEMQYKRSDMDLSRSHFRVRGENIEIFPSYEEEIAIRLEFFDEEIERISIFDPLTGKASQRLNSYTLYPSSHHVTPQEVRLKAMHTIRAELEQRATQFEKENRLLERQRILERTLLDLERIKEMGFCNGIENYSRHFSDRPPGSAPPTLIDYFPQDFLFIIDESHQTIPQMRAMRHGDRARKTSLVEYGFRLPSAYDNRPLDFEEAYAKIHQVVYVSATPGPFELEDAHHEVIEQIIRPTGLLDPLIEVRPATTQVDDCLNEIREHTQKGGRVLVTTLTKKLSEDLTEYLTELDVKAKYLHSDIDTIERSQIIQDLRRGVFDVLVGINLLREGLDIPEVSLVAILDADKEGFLRSETSLVQTCGRAARNAQGRVIMYADKQTKSIQATLEITNRRRSIQQEYNATHQITPQTVYRHIKTLVEQDPQTPPPTPQKTYKNTQEIEKEIKLLHKQMKKKAKELQFQEAAALRDQIHELEARIL